MKVWMIMLAILLSTDAHAIIGRPLTPLSYAGVARRTMRRTAYATTAVAATAAAATLTVLPSGCARDVYGGGSYYRCGGSYYRPAYDGPDVVYVEVDNPS